MSAIRIAVAQMEASEDKASNRDVVARLCRCAARGGASLCLFPEEAMVSLYGGARPADTAESMRGAFVSLLRSLALEHDMTIVAGMHERLRGSDRAYNTIVVVGARGDVLHRYRKLHLYDAFGYCESDQIVPGDGPLVVFDVEPFRLGLLNCYDLRFPEVTRLLVESRADVLLVPAAWQRGPLKEDHWRTLVRARAIENTCWILAAGQAGEHCIGLSMVVDPLGVVRAQLGEEREGVVIHDIDTERIAVSRRLLPGLDQRRYRVDPTVQSLPKASRALAAPAPSPTMHAIQTAAR
ncbi:MAG TPA: carbon-nitrogen hydrolase family protein [Candidatus Micrarchaeia archaeon]|nr:carbon-nitrogen hydrolase family protein [Candidatus Micrarchaeia archaeon]